MSTNTEEVIRDMQRRLNELRTSNKPMAKGVASTHTMQMSRIYVQGLNCAGTKIGDYNSRHEIRVSPKDAPVASALPLGGKGGKKKKKNGKPYKTAFFDSYRDFRSNQGRETGFVNLLLSGNLRSDNAKSLTRTNNETWVTGVSRAENSRKIDGAQSRFGCIYKLTKNEREHLVKVVTEERAKLGI